MKFTPLLSLLLACVSLAAAPQKFNGNTSLEWSEKLAGSEMTRLTEKKRVDNWKWDYASSFFDVSLFKLSERTGNPSFADFATKTTLSGINPDGTIKGFKLDDYSIDNINPGKALFPIYAKSKDERLHVALASLREQMKTHPRTADGGFWHKKRYPHQMWLDGLFMGPAFLAEYAAVFNEPALLDDVAHQIVLMDKHGYDARTGLYYHAWDEQRAQDWADKVTGHSPNFWSRSIGWYAMAIVDSLDYFPASHEQLDSIVVILRRVADGIAKYQDPKTGLWWQVTDQGPRAGNYLEASGSSMFVYALAKGVNKGYLPRDVFEPVILKGYEGLVSELIKTDAKGSVSLTRNCAVAGLGYKNAAGRPRDGTFDYYVSEPIVDNDHKGVASFILAGIELDKMLSSKSTAIVEHVGGWDYAERILSRIKAPVFPDKDFPITDFGAKAGQDSSAAIKAAIEACHTAGGGRVVIPAGEWKTGAIALKSNVNLHISEGATLSFLFDTSKYPIVFTRWEGVECMNFSAFIYAFEQENIAVTGKGTLDGGANDKTWWAWNIKTKDQPPLQRTARNALIEMGEKNVPVEQRIFGEGSFLRPNFIQPYRCKNILVEGVTIINSPMWEIHPVLSSNITVRGVTIHSHGPNNDGCDPESSRDILIENCLFDTGDDCIAIKSGRNNDGRRVNVPSENLVIRNCSMMDGHGGVVLGSEISGGCRNVFVENCVMDSPNLDRGLRLKSNASRGGILENIFMRNVKIGQVAEAVLTIDLLYEEGPRGGFPPVIRNVVIENVTSSASPRVMFIRGFEGALIDGIKFANCTFKGVRAAEVVQGAGSISFRNVSIIPAENVKSANSAPAPVAK
jgi:unsaturated rhamnogalacturonyl hydrolase